MFLCSKCHESCGALHWGGSYGPCEGCGHVASCVDCNAHHAARLETRAVPIDNQPTRKVSNPVPDNTTAEGMMAREREGQTLHDGAIHDPKDCPRCRTDCQPLARIASPGYESFMCCGETMTAPVPTDRLRLCVKSTHDHGVDVLFNLDERDAVHTASVLLSGLSALGSVQITASATESEAGNG